MKASTVGYIGYADDTNSFFGNPLRTWVLVRRRCVEIAERDYMRD